MIKKKTRANKATPPKPKGAVALAKSALGRFQRAGHSASDVPTPERLVRAGGNAHVQGFSDIVEVSRGDKFESETVEKVRIVITDDPFSALCKRKFLATDPARNLALCQAGLRYREAWRGAGFESLKSADLSRIAISTNAGMFSSESSANAFQSFRRIKESMPKDYRNVVDGIVLNDRSPVDIGQQISGYQAPKQATAVALFILRKGLECAAKTLGLLAPE